MNSVSVRTRWTQFSERERALSRSLLLGAMQEYGIHGISAQIAWRLSEVDNGTMSYTLISATFIYIERVEKIQTCKVSEQEISTMGIPTKVVPGKKAS